MSRPLFSQGYDLATAHAAWVRSHEKRRLRRVLLDVLGLLDEDGP